MRYFVQLKDGIVFAHVESSTDQEIIGNNIVEVQENGESLLLKKYENGKFVDATPIKYAILDESNDNTVIGIEQTYFSSDVKGIVVTDPNVKILSKWDGTKFINPMMVEPAQVTVLPVDTNIQNVVNSEDLQP